MIFSIMHKFESLSLFECCQSMIFSKKQNASATFSGKVDFDTSKIKPKIDSKSPAFSADTYYKPHSLEADARTIMKIDAENFELVKKINTIHRTGGTIDCWNREFNYTNTLEEKKTERDTIVKENKQMMTMIEQATGLYCTADLMRDWRKSRAAKESLKNASSKDTKASRNSREISPKSGIENHSGPRCYFEIEIESNRRKLGKLIFQLFPDVVPKTCENFQSYCRGLDGLSYVGTPFHRIVPGYWCQGGDVEKFNGTGETSIYGDKFEDENFDLKHLERGMLSSCSFEKNSNSSKFNLTFERLETMDGKRVVFGKVIGGFSTLGELERFGTKNGKPIMKIVVSKCGVL